MKLLQVRPTMSTTTQTGRRCDTHPEEQVEEEEKILDAVVDRHRGSVSCEIRQKLGRSIPISLFYLFQPCCRLIGRPAPRGRNPEFKMGEGQ